MRHPRFIVPSPRSRSSFCFGLGLALLFAGCAHHPVQTGNDQVPNVNVEIARAKDGKYEDLAWPLVDNEMNAWLDGPTAPGCAAGIAIEDEIVYLHGYGRAVLGGGAEDWSVGTMGAVGSVSKFFTALGAMRQVQDTWVDLETPAGDLLPLSGDLADAPLFALLSHTSGAGGGSRDAAFAPNWNDDSDVAACAGVPTPDPADDECTETHRLELDPTWLAGEYDEAEADHVTALPTVNVDDDPFPDGWEAIYSNFGYTVAGGMVGEAAQDHGYLGYEHYVWDAVGTWSPSWLTPGQATSLALIHEHRATDIPHRAVGYYDANWGVGAKDFQPAEAWQTVGDGGHWIGPAGGWAMTIGDLTRVLVAYRKNQIVSAATRGLMEFPMGYLALGPDAENFPPYGLGLFIDDTNHTIFHGGDIGPYDNEHGLQSSHSAHFSWWKDPLPGGVDVGVTLICNNGRGSSSLYSQAKDIVEALQADPTSRPAPPIGFATSPSPSGVHRGTWVLDTSRAYLLRPAGLPVVPSALAPLAITADLERRTLAVRRQGSGATGTLGALATAGLSTSGRLEASGGTVQLPVGPASLPLRSAALSLQVSNDATRVFDGRVQGRVDARDLVALGAASSTAEVCTAVAQTGERCDACADGARTCFPAAMGGVTGRRQQ